MLGNCDPSRSTSLFVDSLDEKLELKVSCCEKSRGTVCIATRILIILSFVIYHVRTDLDVNFNRTKAHVSAFMPRELTCEVYQEKKTKIIEMQHYLI
jgi:hypothetical protein